jgi:starch phosphorylase
MSLPGASVSRHPALTVAELTRRQLDQLASDEAFVARVNQELGDLGELMSRAREPAIAYFSLEFGLTATLPLYAGGLGVLAGDHLKTSSDLGLPLVGVGLFYRRGVFQQVIDDNRQREEYRFAGPEDYGAQDTGIVVRIPLPGRDVAARVWRLDIGRTPLILLDTYVSTNSEADREIADRLYIGFTNERINQEMILGVGGARALQALGWPINVYHLNEGHAGFLNLELIDRAIDGSEIGRAVEKTRPGLVFTTHTPVPAGIDRFDRELRRLVESRSRSGGSKPLQHGGVLSPDRGRRQRGLRTAW